MTTTAQALEALDRIDKLEVANGACCTLRQHIESTAAEIGRLQAECEALRKDAERLDYLDARNAAKNAKNGTTYGWRLTENHNRIALEDHNWPVLDVRAAIDAALSTSTAPSGAEE